MATLHTPLSSEPNKMWEVLSVKQKVESIKPQAMDTPKPPDHTRFVCISGIILYSYSLDYVLFVVL